MTHVIQKKSSSGLNGFIVRAAGLLKRLDVAFARRYAVRKARADLYAFTDYELRDIGLTRGEIENALRPSRMNPNGGPNSGRV